MHLRLTLPSAPDGWWDGRRKEGGRGGQTDLEQVAHWLGGDEREREGEKESEISPKHHARLGADSMRLHRFAP